MTASELFAAEPYLAEIVEEAALARGAENPWPVYAKAKARALKLVGWGARKKALRSSAAYDCFIGYLVERMEI